MSWPRRHELLDVDLDAYANDDEARESDNAQPADLHSEAATEEQQISSLEAAERAGIPLEVLLPKLDP